LGQGDPGGQHQAGMMPLPPRRYSINSVLRMVTRIQLASA